MTATLWKIGASGDWETALDWTSDTIPNGGDAVTIGVSGTYTITVLVGEAAGSLSLKASGATLLLDAELSVSGTFSETSGTIAIASGQTLSVSGSASFGVEGNFGGTVRGPGTLATSGAVTVVAQTNGDPQDLIIGGGVTWSNTGTVTDAGLIYYGLAGKDTATIANQAGAVFDLTTANADIEASNGGTATFTNAGTLEKTGGAATSTISAAVANAATGVVSVASGTLSLAGGGTLGGTLETSGGGVIALAAGSFTLANATVPAALLIDGGTAAASTPITLSGSLSETSGTIAIASGQTLSVSGSASFGVEGNFGGTVRGPGTLATSGAVTVVAQTNGDPQDLIIGGGVTWSNTGTVTDAGLIYYGLAGKDTATIANQAGAVFDLTTANADIEASNGGTATFTNAGTLEKTGGAATSTISAAVANAATGVVSVASGTLSLAGGGTLGGTLETSGGGVIALAAGSFTLANATVPAALLIDGGTAAVSTPITLSGSLSETSGTIAIASGQTLSVSGSASFGVEGNFGGTVRGPGTLATSGAVTVVAQTNGDPQDLIIGGGVTWSNTGTVTDAGLIYYGLAGKDTATIANQAGAVFDLTTANADIEASNGGTATFTNAGTLEKTGGAATSTISAAVANAATGVVSVASGTLSLAGGGTLGGTLETSGGGVIALAAGSFTLANATVPAALLIDGGTAAVSTPITLSGSLSETSGTIAIASGQTLSVSGSASFGVEGNFGGTVRGPGTLATSGAVTVVAQTNGDPQDLIIGGGVTWSNTGTVTDAGLIYYGLAGKDTATIANQAGAVFDLTTANADIEASNGGTATLTNAGTLEKTGGAATSTISAAVANAATGVVSVASGTLSLAGGGTLGGTLETSGGGVIALAAGSFTLANATVPAALLIDGGTAAVSTPITLSGSLSETSGTIAIASGQTLSVSGSASFGVEGNFGGTVRGPGTLATSGAVTVVAQTNGDPQDLIIGGGVTWSNTGTVTDAGLIYYGLAGKDTATIANQAGAVFDLTTANADIEASNGGTATFTNAGTLEKTGGAATSTISAAVANAATGVVSVASGTLSLAGGGTLGGTLETSGGGVIALAAGSFTLANATVPAALLIDGGTAAASTPITLSGSLSETSGTIAIASGQTLSVSGSASFGVEGNFGGTVRGPGTLATSGAVTVVAQTNGDPQDLIIGGGVTWSNTGTVTDAGLIYYGLAGKDTATIANQAGAVFDLTTANADIEASNGGTATLTNAGTLEKTGGAATSTISAAVANAATGVVSVTSGTLSLTAALSNAGRIIADTGGEVVLGAVTADTGSITIGGAGTIDFTVATGADVAFGNPGGKLILATPTTYAGTIFNIEAGDTINLPGIAYNSTGTAQILPGNILHVVEGSKTLNLQLDRLENFSAAVPHLVMDGAGSDITLTGVTCFAAGTLIATERGEVAVEALQAGDLIVTVEGARPRLRPARWIGRRRVDLRRHPRPDLARPVRIRRDAFSDGTPSRDLLVSPEHCLFVDGMLVPARLLLNGGSIAQEDGFTSIEYFHIEFDCHALLLAEGLTAESYLDTGNRAMFDGETPCTLHPEFAIDPSHKSWKADACAPLATDPARVEPLWRLLRDRSEAIGVTTSSFLTTEDPLLQLEADDRLLRSVHVIGSRHMFMLSSPASVLRIISRSAQPCDTRPWLDDRRLLGVCVRRLVLPDGSGFRKVAVDQLGPAPGWHGVEGVGALMCRWTDGRAEINRHIASGVVEIELLGEMLYPSYAQHKCAAVALQ